MRLTANDWLESIAEQPDAKARWQKTLQAFESYGFDHILFIRGDVRQQIDVSTSVNEDFLTYYAEQNLAACDPILRICAGSYHSVRTGKAHAKEMCLSHAERQMSDIAYDAGAGFNTGFTCTLEPLTTGRLSAWNIATQLSVAEADKILAEEQHNLQRLCYLLPRLLVSSPPSPPLTPREQQVLYLLAYEGLQHQQIAEELHIALPTVRFHLKQIREKLDAKTSEQAIARAIESGLIRS